MKRQRLTKFEFASLFLAQGGKCGCGCGERLEAGKIDEEHTNPHFFQEDDPDYDGKPDSLWRRACHQKTKTPKDRKAIAKTNRIIRKAKGEWRTNRKKIESRGFDKTFKKKFSGEVVRK